MNIELNTEKNFVIRAEETKSIKTLTIERIVDSPIEKRVYVRFRELIDNVDLWLGNSYDAIGQWTEDDVVNRVKELYGA